MKPTIGLAIPCSAKHYTYIPTLLQNIAASTDKPDQVVVSCSSWFLDRRDSFVFNTIPVTILFTGQKLNAAQNRNRAARHLETEVISFLDADDLMHPRRIEFLRDTFASRPDVSAVYHSYSWDSVSKRYDPFWTESDPKPIADCIAKDPNAFGLLVTSGDSLHHAHVTVRRHVFAQIQFSEASAHARLEDSLYGAALVAANVPMLFLANRLTRYIFMD